MTTAMDALASLEALQRRLSHARAICRLIAQQDDTNVGEAVCGIVVMLDDADGALEGIMDATRGPEHAS